MLEGVLNHWNMSVRLRFKRLYNSTSGNYGEFLILEVKNEQSSFLEGILRFLSLKKNATEDVQEILVLLGFLKGNSERRRIVRA